MKRRLVIGAGLVSVAAALFFMAPKISAVFRHPLAAWLLLRMDAPKMLPVPVQGVRPAQLRDSWDAPRSGGRQHRGIDIFARRGTPVISATNGIVATVGTNSLGGRIVRVFGPSGEWHYYAHLEGYGSVHPGDRISAGTVVGFVGDSGNARGTPPHLHYGIYQFYGGATNPYPRLAGRSGHKP